MTQLKNQQEEPCDWHDERLVGECLRNNERAWNALVDRYKGLVFKVCLDYTRHQADASDVFQEVWAQAHRRLGTLRDTGSLAAWLTTVTRNACYRWLKKRHQLEQRETRGHGLDELDSRASVLQVDLTEKDTRQRVHAAIAELPPRCQEVITMLFFRQPALPYRDVAERLEMAIGSVPFVRARCLARLQKLLSPPARPPAGPLRPPP